MTLYNVLSSLKKRNDRALLTHNVNYPKHKTRYDRLFYLLLLLHFCGHLTIYQLANSFNVNCATTDLGHTRNGGGLMQPKIISRHPHVQIFKLMPLYLSAEDSALLLQMLGKLMANTVAHFISEIYAVMLRTSCGYQLIIYSEGVNYHLVSVSKFNS